MNRVAPDGPTTNGDLSPGGASAYGAEPRSRSLGTLLLIVIIAAAVVFRLYLLAATDFPINDGGLFYAFVEGIARTFPALPESVSYNGLTIPFAYPPLAFWIGALLTELGLAPLEVVRATPIVMNIVYIMLFALLLLRSGRSALFTALALLFLCTMLRSFGWLIMGGGLSRGLGAIFLLLTLFAIGIPGRERGPPLRWWRLALAGLCVGCAILSHFEWGVDAAACVIVSRALGSPSVKDFVRSNLIAGSVAATVVAPWLLLVIQVHGVAPLLAAGGSSSWGLLTPIGHLISFLLSSLTNPLILIGGVIALRRREYFWPAFFLLCLVLTPRHAFTPATLALAVFCAQAIMSLHDLMERRGSSPTRAAGIAAAAAAAALLFQSYRGITVDSASYRPLDGEVRVAMAWVAATHPHSAFLVVTDRPWWLDASAEWFPILARARSVNTVQGREWLPNRAFARWNEMDLALKQSRSCEEALAVLTGHERPQFIWAEARKDCFAAPAFQPVYRNAKVTIFRVTPAARWVPTPVSARQSL